MFILNTYYFHSKRDSAIHTFDTSLQSHLPYWPPLISGHLPWVASFNPARSFLLYILTGLSGHLSNMASGQ